MGRDRQIYNIEHFNLLTKLRYQFVNSKSRMICREEYIAINVELDKVFNVRYRVPKNPQESNWVCKDCGEPVFYNTYFGCFKHHGQKAEGFEPETIEHKTMKDYWYNIFRKL